MRKMRFFRTLISATLISTVLFSSIIFTGCGKTSKGTVKIIQEDDTWYDSVSFDVDPGIELDASEEMDCAALTILDDTVYGIYTKIDYDDLSGGSILHLMVRSLLLEFPQSEPYREGNQRTPTKSYCLVS